ncbi:MAG: lysozyme inhibitor LprI family protein [Terracidiphilus sp.]
MRFLSGSSHRGKVLPSFLSAGLAFAALVFATIIPAGLPAAAQDPAPAQAQPETPPPPPVVLDNPIPSDQLAFLSAYAGRPTKELFKDKQFRALMKRVTPNTTYHYGHDLSLAEARDIMLDGSPQQVVVGEGRYVMVPGDRGPMMHGRGFMWFDMKEGIALGGVYFRPSNGEPTPTLAIYSRQLKVTSLTMTQMPVEFASDVMQWSAQEGIRPVTTRYFIPDNGKKYVLMHDEDYCDHPPDQPAPPQDQCQQLNAEAADDDLNGADFMAQTHNAANATAWMLSPAQTAWIGIRDQSCGGVLACRVRLTRQRVRVMAGQQR